MMPADNKITENEPNMNPHITQTIMACLDQSSIAIK